MKNKTKSSNIVKIVVMAIAIVTLLSAIVFFVYVAISKTNGGYRGSNASSSISYSDAADGEDLFNNDQDNNSSWFDNFVNSLFPKKTTKTTSQSTTATTTTKTASSYNNTMPSGSYEDDEGWSPWIPVK